MNLNPADTVHSLIMSFYKHALFLAHLESSSGFLETIAMMPLSVTGTRLENAWTGALQSVTSTVLGASGQASRQVASSNLCCSQNLSSYLNLTCFPSSSFLVTFSCHLPFTSSSLCLILHWAFSCRFRSFSKFCQGQRNLGKG